MIPLIKPMLASPPKAERLEALRGTHSFDTKIDGLRALVYVDDVVTIINRSGNDITAVFPDVERNAECFLPYGVYDGEIVAVSGSFQDTARRGKQSKPADVVHCMAEIPVSFVAFDIPYGGNGQGPQGFDLRNLPWEARRQHLVQAFADLDPHSGLQTSVVSPEPEFFEQVKALGMEGVIAKRLRSTYRAGRFSDWLKFKTVRSITAIGIGYERGTGARAHFGAMFLALVDDNGTPVEVGRVGTGFTAREITDLKERLDAGVPVLVEIECLNKSKDGKLRFPVYKGIRSPELSLADARLSQLDDIPTM